MKDYSQFQEQAAILGYFGSRVGNFLDLGAWHAEIYSNTRALIELGWSGLLVEANPAAVNALVTYHKGNDRVRVVDALVTHEDAATVVPFWQSEGEGLSSTHETHARAWGVHDRPMLKGTTPLRLILNQCRTPLHFISVDCEGSTPDLFAAIPLRAMGVELVCVEVDAWYKERTGEAEIMAHAAREGYRVRWRSDPFLNLILERVE
jgi:hypothetical protein